MPIMPRSSPEAIKIALDILGPQANAEQKPKKKKSQDEKTKDSHLDKSVKKLF